MTAKHSTDQNDSHREPSRRQNPPRIDGLPGLPKHGVLTRLYTGTGAFDVIGRRKVWFAVSGVIFAIAIASILIRGFSLRHRLPGWHHGVGTDGNVTAEQAEEVYRNTLGQDPEQVVIVGSGGSATVQIRSER